ncbi:MAG: Uma2 family endonuclease [Bacteroidia bacterium]|nr:Uma2 family endonuclease [Bacteroidia bacterium]
MQPLKHQKMTIKEYLALEESSREKFEFSQGLVWAMSGATPNHALISGNLAREIGSRIKPGDCRVYGGELRVRIEKVDSFLHPDLTVVCGKSEYSSLDKHSIINPTVIIEILSPSTERYDRFDKFDKYMTIPTLTQLVMIRQEKPFLHSYSKREDGTWSFEKLAGLDGFLKFTSLGIEIPLSGIYLDVENLLSPMYFSDQEE